MPNDSKLSKYKNDFVTSNTKYKIKKTCNEKEPKMYKIQPKKKTRLSRTQ